MAVTWNTQVATVTWTAVDDPSVTWVVQVDATVTGGGGGGVELGETSTTAYRGDRGKTAYDHSQVTTGNPHGTTASDVGADPAGTAAGLVDDLSGVSNQATARTNLGLGSAAVEAASAFATAAQGVDARTPTAHKTSHENGGSDELALDASQITTGTVAQDRLGTGSAGAGAKFLADDQTYKTVSSGIADPGGANDDFLQRKSGAWTYRTVAQVKTDLGVTPHVPYISSNYYSAMQGQGATTAGLNAAGRMGAHPVYLPAGSYASIGVYVGGAAVSTWRLGIYSNDPTKMAPNGQSLVVDAGTVNMNSGTGLLSATATITIPTSGIYWLAALCDSYTATPSVYGFVSGQVVPPTLPWVGNTAESMVAGYISPLWGALSITTGSMPATFPAISGSVFRAVNYVPYLFVKAA